MLNGSQFTAIGELKYSQYDQTAYRQSAGIVDVPFSPQDADKIRTGLLAVRVAADPGKTALAEQALTAQTDQRGLYIEEKEEVACRILLRQHGVPVRGAKVLVATYDADQNVVAASAASNPAITRSDRPAMSSGSTP